MHTTGTIYPDGRVQYHGYEPMKSRLLAVTRDFIAVHHPGGTYWDNGGEHYVSARVEVWPLDFLRRANEEDTWQFGFARGRTVEYHPTVKEATARAVHRLQQFGDDLVAEIERKRENDNG